MLLSLFEQFYHVPTPLKILQLKHRDYKEFDSSTSEQVGRAMYSPLQLNQL